ncbi:hypothetical protein D3C87_1613730 [compost metagenome]
MSLFYKTPEYKKAIVYDWQKPDFNPEEDAFMKHFDENGNFVPVEKQEEEVEFISLYFSSDQLVNYFVTKSESDDKR